MAATEAPPVTPTEAPTWHMLAQEGVGQELGVDPDRGLSSEEAAKDPSPQPGGVVAHAAPTP